MRVGSGKTIRRKVWHAENWVLRRVKVASYGKSCPMQERLKPKAMPASKPVMTSEGGSDLSWPARSLSCAPIPHGVALVVSEQESIGALYQLPGENYVQGLQFDF